MVASRVLCQERAPIFEALKGYLDDGVMPFHVPGHKQGRGLVELRDFIGPSAMAIDLTCLPGLDNICNPVDAIAEAEALAADAFGADHAFFLVNGTTSGIQAMLMAVCQPGDKVIIPRNAHKSATGGLILSGAQPVYLRPGINREFGISTVVTPEDVEQALAIHPDAKAVFVINPNYYGTAPDLKGIVNAAHSHGIPVLVDEAHGAHLHFHPGLPLSAMDAGADLAASSTHKLGGSLTQSSMLLQKGNIIDPARVKAVLNLTQTTSPSYLLLASLDLARRQAALRGSEIWEGVLKLAMRARGSLREMPLLKIMEGAPCPTDRVSLDATKVTINVTGLGYSGYQAEKILRQQFRLQVELSDLCNVLILLSLGDDDGTIARLEEAFGKLISQSPGRKVIKYLLPIPEIPLAVASPREAFYSLHRRVHLEDAAGEVSAEGITAYPPGIPLICPGEVLTQEIIDYINLLKMENAELQGTEDSELKTIKVLAGTIAASSQKEAIEAMGSAG